MNAVGIDVSSRKSTVAVLRPLGEVVFLPFDGIVLACELTYDIQRQFRRLLVFFK